MDRISLLLGIFISLLLIIGTICSIIFYGEEVIITMIVVTITIVPLTIILILILKRYPGNIEMTSEYIIFPFIYYADYRRYFDKYIMKRNVKIFFNKINSIKEIRANTIIILSNSKIKVPTHYIPDEFYEIVNEMGIKVNYEKADKFTRDIKRLFFRLHK